MWHYNYSTCVQFMPAWMWNLKFKFIKLSNIGEVESIHQQEHKNYGGPRLTTFMVYLSQVESGGHTVFPTIDLYVKPKAGDALFWFNLNSSGDYDTRNIHLGIDD